ncbi:hypothetical protein [Dongia sp.]|uniref:hypothetical protein n=1 Tax=Dongia sp. TaxID=1977262 RepID=UPI0035B3EE86
MPPRALNRDDLIAVAENMRAADRREIFATRFDENAELLAEDLLAGDPLGVIVADRDGVPAAVLGATEMWPGLWSLWMFATDRWPSVARETTRFAKRVLWPALLKLGLRRGECRSAAEHHVAHRWLRHLGGAVESIHPAYGKGGETFIGFVIYGERHVCDPDPQTEDDDHRQQRERRPDGDRHGCR